MCHLTHIGAVTLPYTVNTTVLRESEGTTEKGLRLTLGVDNEAGLAWLEDALAYAFAHSRPGLWAYLEAVMDDVLFEMELETRL
jgi:hypothetical protein